MTTFSFNENIPAANNNPSADQPIMQTNNASTKSILAVDHLTFDSAGSGGAGASAGQHLKVTYNSKTTPAPGAPVDPISISNTASAQDALAVPTAIGSASSVAQEFFTNQNGKFATSAIKAFGVFTGTAGLAPFSPTMSLNVVDITKPGPTANTYDINLVSGAVIGLTVVVLITCDSNSTGFTWTYSANKLTIFGANASAGKIFSFAILQI